MTDRPIAGLRLDVFLLALVSIPSALGLVISLANHLLPHMLLGPGLIIASLLFVAWLGNRLLIRPLRALVAAAERLAAGEQLPATLAHPQINELRCLACVLDAFSPIVRDANITLVTKEKLRITEAQLQMIVEHVPVMLLAAKRDASDPILEGNLHEAIQQALGGDEVARELKVDGHVLEFHIRPIRDGRGQVAAAIGFGLDITEQQHTQLALQESEILFRSVWEASSDALALSDEQGIVVAANPAYCTLYGYPSEQVVKHNFTKIFPQELQAWALAGYLATFRAQQPIPRAEAVIRRSDGSERIVESRADFVRHRQGQVLMLSSIRDISERKQAEEALRESEHFAQRIADTIPHVLYLYDLESEQIVYSNREMATILGYGGEQVPTLDPMLVTALVHPNDLDEIKLYRARLATMAEGEQIEREYRVQHASGEWRWLYSRETLFSTMADGTPKLMLGVAQDITERKREEETRRQIERKLQETQRLESLGVLAGGIAHDFNNLLMGMLGYANLAREELARDTTLYEYISQIETAAQRATDLVRQMLDYAGKSRVVIQRITINTIAEEISQLLHASIAKNIVLRYELDPHLPPIDADPVQIRQVLMNLVVNAAEAIGHTPGIITLTTSLCTVTREYVQNLYYGSDIHEGQYLSIVVSDTGSGMDEITQTRIFEPFFTTKFTGRGLGLAAVLGIVRGHGGAIRLESELGRGSTFTILLPVAPARSEALSEQHTPVWRGTGVVLLADDEPDVRAVCSRILERMGFQVLAASNGRESLELFKEHMQKIVCVVLDLTMPELDGMAAFRLIHAINPAIPVILASGYDGHDIAGRVASEGLAGFLQKPFMPQELRSLMQRVLEGAAGTQ